MKDQWILYYAGTSEDDEAHLRLLLRSARKRLSKEWAWGSESEADLLLVDGHAEADGSATTHALREGRASAQLVGADDAIPESLFLRRPFHAEAFVALLNDVTHAEDGEPSPLAHTLPVIEAASTSGQAEPLDPTIATTTAQTGSTARPAANNPPSSPASATAPAGDENLMRALLYYLPKRVLGGPARIAMAGAPPLVIDPESRMFWAEGSLPDLEPYFRKPLRFGDWQRLTNEELEDVRKSRSARVCACLIWMDTYLQSKGVLSRRFDPEGTYRLNQRLELANDYPRALRISAQMTQPRKLEAISRASGADLAEVHDVVNAYEAIGYLEWTRPGAPRRT